MKFIYKEKEIYNKENITNEIDEQGDESKLFEKEKRLMLIWVILQVEIIQKEQIHLILI